MKVIKRPFQLLEIMIAFFLIIVCAIPLIQTYVAMHIEQKEQNRIIEADHLVEEAHAKIVEDFYRKRLGLSQIEDSQEREIDDESIVAKAKKLGMKISYKFELDSPKKIDAKTKDILVKVHIIVEKLDAPSEKKITVTYILYAVIQNP